jgi:hypothetical protein
LHVQIYYKISSSSRFGAYLALGCALSAAGSAVYYAHSSAAAERARMHVGVLRDIAAEEALAANKVSVSIHSNSGSPTSISSQMASNTEVSSESTSAETLQKRLNPKVVAGGGIQRNNTFSTNPSLRNGLSSISSLNSNSSILSKGPLVSSNQKSIGSTGDGIECVNGVCDLKQTRFKTKVQ